MHSKFLRFFQYKSRCEIGPAFPVLHFHFSVLHFPVLHFLILLKFGPSFPSRVGQSLIYLAPHWSFIFRSCMFSRPDSLGYICVTEGMALFSTTLTQLATNRLNSVK